MRQYLLITIVLIGAGCQGLGDSRRRGHDCQTSESCKPEKKACAPHEKVAAPKEKVGAPREEVTEQIRAAALAQEVLLVPRTVYMPFVAQAPTAPVRLTSNMTVMQQPSAAPPVSAPPEKDKVTSPPVTPCPPQECTQQQLLDICQKLNKRLDCIEECIQGRKVAPGAVCPPADPCCPPPQPLLPQLFRRPLFNRCEPSLPACEPVQQFESMDTQIRSTITNGGALSPVPQPAQPIESLAAPARTLNTNPDANVNTNPPLSLPQPLPVDPPAPMLPNE